MTFFSFYKGESIHLAPDTRIVPAEDFFTLVTAKQVLDEATTKSIEYKKEIVTECETLKEKAIEEGFNEGLKKWNEQLALLEKEMSAIRKEMEEATVPLVLAALRKIIGRELEINPQAIVDVVVTALKRVSQQHKIVIHVNPSDLEIVDQYRQRLKDVFEHLHSLTISPRADVEKGGCIIETETGILNAQLSHQLEALETAFRHLLQHSSQKEKS